MEATRAGGPTRGPVAAPMARECSFTGFMKCGPTQFHGTEGAAGLVCWFKRMENTFEISECVEGKKVATLGREVANERPWTEVKQMMTMSFVQPRKFREWDIRPRTAEARIWLQMLLFSQM
nr:hypothetical protein [Tanacetum cinerariifolium]